MEKNESERLQQEIKYWTSVISSHKKSTLRFGLQRKSDVSKTHTWNNARTVGLPNTTTHQSSAHKMAKVNRKVDSRFSTSKTTMSKLPPSAHLHGDVQKIDETIGQSTSKYKWESLPSASVSHSSKASFKFISSSSTEKRHNLTPPAGSSKCKTPKLSPKPLLKTKPNLSTSSAKDTSRFKWSKTTKPSPLPSASHLDQTSSEKSQQQTSPMASVPKKRILHTSQANTRHRYRRLSSGSDKTRTRRLSGSASKSSIMSNYILSKYKLRKTPSLTRRLSVNLSKDPYKVIKKRSHKPLNCEVHKKRIISGFARTKMFRRNQGNLDGRPRAKRRYVYVAPTNQLQRRRNSNRSKRPLVTNSRFKLVRSRVQTRSHKSGNIVLRRKLFSVNRKNNVAHFVKPLAHTPTAKQRLASHVLHKSLETMRSKNRHKLQKVYCIFYNRFGKCNRGDKCKYTHDPDRVAICTQFLRGTCRDEACPFSHKASKHKMPVCNFFLRGKCSAKNCPYLHVFVGHDAPVCKDFATNGYCPQADNCKKLHIRACPEYYDKGTCSRASACKLPHRRKASRKRKGTCQVVPSSSQPRTRPRPAVESTSKEDSDFISLPKSTSEERSAPSDDQVPRNVRIQPQLRKKLP